MMALDLIWTKFSLKRGLRKGLALPAWKSELHYQVDIFQLSPHNEKEQRYLHRGIDGFVCTAFSWFQPDIKDPELLILWYRLKKPSIKYCAQLFLSKAVVYRYHMWFPGSKNFCFPKQALQKWRFCCRADFGKQSLVLPQFRQPQDVGFLRASPESKNKSSNRFPLDNTHLVLHNEIIKTMFIYAKLPFTSNL